MVSGNLLIFSRIVTVAGFKIARAFLTLFQCIAWRLNGTQRRLNKMYRDADNTHVHVVKIVKCHKFDLLQGILKQDFIYTHNRFESMDYILKSDYVTLVTINDREAIFVETEKGVDVWRSSVSSFIRLAQMDLGKFLIFVPLATFKRLSEQLPEPSNILYLFNTARCGSTLLTQMCEWTKLCVSVSEPDALYVLAQRYADGHPLDELKANTKDVIKWICRPYSYINPQAYVIKVTAPAIELLPVLQEVFPAARNIFMYRNFLKVAQSLHRMSQELPSLRLAYILGRHSAAGTEKCIRSMGFPSKDYRMKCPNDLALGVLICIVITKVYRNMRAEGKDVVAVRYEDLVGNKEYACQNIVKYCRLPDECVADALKGLEQDSQRNSIISAAILRRHRDPELTPEAEEFANDLLNRAEMPLLRECPLFPGTITAKTL